MNRRSLLKWIGLAPVAVVVAPLIPAQAETSISEVNNQLRLSMTGMSEKWEAKYFHAPLLDDRFWSGSAPMQGIGLDRNRMRQ